MAIKKGINQWTFSDELSIEQCMKLAKDAGFEGIELVLVETETNEPGDKSGVFNWFFNYRNNEFTLNTPEDKLKELKTIGDRIGIKVCSIASTLLFKYPLSSKDVSTRQKGKEVVKKALEAGSILGADTFLTIPGLVTEEESYAEVYTRSMETIKELASLAEKYKVSIALENVWNKFLLSPLEFVRFIDEIGSDYVGAYFDVGNILLYGFPNHWLEILGPRIKKIHLDDFKTSIGTIEGFVNILEGEVNWPLVKETLGKIAYDDYVVAEIAPPYRHFPERVLYEISENVSKILGK